MDSALLALRLARTERRDVLLLNYVLGAEDDHGRAAAEIARRLGMRIARVTGDLSDSAPSLGRAFRDYAAPFVDPAVVTTNDLAYASVRDGSGPPAVIDGTGADGAFAFGFQARLAWKRALGVPVSFRRVAATGYDVLRLWRFQSRIEKAVREMRSLSRMSLHQAAVSFAPLEGVAFNTARRDREEVDRAVAAIFESQHGLRAVEDQLAYLDLVHTCAGRFANKTFDPLRSHGAIPVYPYLDPRVVRVALSIPWQVKCRNGSLKAVLREELIRELPRELVYLPKQGFVAPVLSIVRQPSVRPLLCDVVLREDNPVMDSCSPGVVRGLLARVHEGHAVSLPARRFLWSLLWVSMWIHGARSELSAARS